ncbi:hypothetical protein ACFSUS_05025 [Spirosoma soli]|uniref:Uncharacterized protein n=1 Tax=Spirosoma soli TaxID=1770529 RepID=A0ABW5LYW2_9BACT
METKPKLSHIRNPFAGAADEKAVWKKLSENSRPTSKEEFLEKARRARQLRKDD